MSLFRINTNVSALNAQRQLDNGNDQLAEAQERLSSGLRINSAADDAAGLAISQKTTTQIKGLNQASTNAQDGISMIQTAEGGLSETQGSLQRMRELSVQASNDTLTESDREQIQGEVDALAEEIQRISDQTEFNTKNLLDGSLESGGELGTQQLQVGANEGQVIEFNVSDMGTSDEALDVAGAGQTDDTVDGFTGSAKNLAAGSAGNGEYTVKQAGDDFKLMDENNAQIGSSGDGVEFAINSSSDLGAVSASIKFAAKIQDGQSFTVSGGAVNSGSTKAPNLQGTNKGLEAGTYEISGENSGAKLVDQSGETVATLQSTGKFQSGTTTKLDYSDVTASSQVFNGVFDSDETITIGGPDITTTDDAKASIKTLDDAINEVSSERSELGALQNRLETTISVDDITSENLEAARSRIRDADVAQESVKQTRGNILVQAGTSVLAQANQNPQSALQLLGG